MNGKRQKTHWSVALDPAGEGEALSGGTQGPNRPRRSQHPKARLLRNN